MATPTAAPVGRVKQLKEEDDSRPRSDSTGSRTRSWSGVEFESPGRPRTFSVERGEKNLVVLAVDASKAAENAFQWFLDTLCTPEFFLVLLHIPEIPPPPLVGQFNDFAFIYI
ncbi:hypothetical protein CAPTEDRAFT_192834 [Capitella teleta]|uniref:UspA domain-containing protein n=1 Tax=Capitella teleta TaxID=283909 RepID=R7VGA1_CAPTE|nr:hypothetical protein CAPTEDRAFT_192834 [Capitella teleta]|eukprot:ELU17644.1 hypothetical protein CAPTEDRAFT_192834 [Capitella teleta]